MDFSKLRLEDAAPCECMSGSTENTSTVFIRRISEKHGLKDRHFKHDLEKPNRNLVVTDCNSFCSFREISIDDISNHPVADVIANYMPAIHEQLEISPKKEFFYCAFTFATGSGTVKSTPEHGYVSHHDFYKSDEFSVQLITQIAPPVPIIPTPSPAAQVTTTSAAMPVLSSLPTTPPSQAS